MFDSHLSPDGSPAAQHLLSLKLYNPLKFLFDYKFKKRVSGFPVRKAPVRVSVLLLVVSVRSLNPRRLQLCRTVSWEE